MEKANKYIHYNSKFKTCNKKKDKHKIYYKIAERALLIFNLLILTIKRIFRKLNKKMKNIKKVIRS
jgi:hypothetical protein